MEDSGKILNNSAPLQTLFTTLNLNVSANNAPNDKSKLPEGRQLIANVLGSIPKVPKVLAEGCGLNSISKNVSPASNQEHDASGKKVKKKVRGKKKKKESIETKHTCIRASTSSNGSDDENTPEEEKRCKKKKKQFKTVLSRMDDDLSVGPLSLLNKAWHEQTRIRVHTRNLRGVHSVLTGYLTAFDKHFNMTLKDVDEVYMRPIIKPKNWRWINSCIAQEKQEAAAKATEKAVAKLEDEKRRLLEELKNCEDSTSSKGDLEQTDGPPPPDSDEDARDAFDLRNKLQTLRDKTSSGDVKPHVVTPGKKSWPPSPPEEDFSSDESCSRLEWSFRARRKPEAKTDDVKHSHDRVRKNDSGVKKRRRSNSESDDKNMHMEERQKSVDYSDCYQKPHEDKTCNDKRRRGLEEEPSDNELRHPIKEKSSHCRQNIKLCGNTHGKLDETRNRSESSKSIRTRKCDREERSTSHDRSTGRGNRARHSSPSDVGRKRVSERLGRSHELRRSRDFEYVESRDKPQPKGLRSNKRESESGASSRERDRRERDRRERDRRERSRDCDKRSRDLRSQKLSGRRNERSCRLSSKENDHSDDAGINRITRSRDRGRDDHNLGRGAESVALTDGKRRKYRDRQHNERENSRRGEIKSKDRRRSSQSPAEGRREGASGASNRRRNRHGHSNEGRRHRRNSGSRERYSSHEGNRNRMTHRSDNSVTSRRERNRGDRQRHSHHPCDGDRSHSHEAKERKHKLGVPGEREDDSITKRSSFEKESPTSNCNFDRELLSPNEDGFTDSIVDDEAEEGEVETDEDDDVTSRTRNKARAHHSKERRTDIESGEKDIGSKTSKRDDDVTDKRSCRSQSGVTAAGQHNQRLSSAVESVSGSYILRPKSPEQSNTGRSPVRLKEVGANPGKPIVNDGRRRLDFDASPDTNRINDTNKNSEEIVVTSRGLRAGVEDKNTAVVCDASNLQQPSPTARPDETAEAKTPRSIWPEWQKYLNRRYGEPPDGFVWAPFGKQERETRTRNGVLRERHIPAMYIREHYKTIMEY